MKTLAHSKDTRNNELDTFVHCARVMSDEEYYTNIKGVAYSYNLYDNKSLDDVYFDNREVFGWCENYKGFISYKHIVKQTRKEQK